MGKRYRVFLHREQRSLAGLWSSVLLYRSAVLMGEKCICRIQSYIPCMSISAYACCHLSSHPAPLSGAWLHPLHPPPLSLTDMRHSPPQSCPSSWDKCSSPSHLGGSLLPTLPYLICLPCAQSNSALEVNLKVLSRWK